MMPRVLDAVLRRDILVHAKQLRELEHAIDAEREPGMTGSILKWQEKNQSCFVHDLVAVGVALAMHAVVRVEDERVHELAPRRTGVGASGARPSTRLRKSGPSPRVK